MPFKGVKNKINQGVIFKSRNNELMIKNKNGQIVSRLWIEHIEIFQIFHIINLLKRGGGWGVETHFDMSFITTTSYKIID